MLLGLGNQSLRGIYTAYHIVDCIVVFKNAFIFASPASHNLTCIGVAKYAQISSEKGKKCAEK